VFIGFGSSSKPFAERAVAVPVFVTPSEATREEIPAKLELDRGGIRYADVLGDHQAVTDAIQATVEQRRVLVEETETPAPSRCRSSSPAAPSRPTARAGRAATRPEPRFGFSSVFVFASPSSTLPLARRRFRELGLWHTM